MSNQTNDLPSHEVDLKALYDRYAGWFRARLISRYGRQDAEDLIQETWLRLSRYRLGKEIRHPRALMLRIAANLASNRSASRTRRNRHLELATVCERQQLVLPSQIEDLLLKELVLGLPEALRDVFLLSRLDGLTNAQIGETLGISPKTVEWRMTRALAHCAAQLRR